METRDGVVGDPVGKKVLLYSGGLDSYCASYLLKPDVNLYVGYGGCYQSKELQHLPQPPHGELHVYHAMDLGELERPADLILPQRNAFLVMIAAYYGDEIWLGATAGDRSSDKDASFAHFMQMLLRQLWSVQHWLPQSRLMEVKRPLAEMSKAEIVTRYLAEFGDADKLRTLTSCYDVSLKHCGRCKPCARGWAALKVNGVELPEYDSNPRDYFVPYLSKIITKTYRGDPEDTDIFRAMNMARREQ